jgi:hypothetical protein
MPVLNVPQSKFLKMRHKFRAFVGGYRSGKTWAGCSAICARFWSHPRINQGYFAPTYPQIRDIFYPTIEEVAYGMELRVDIKEANKEVHFYGGSGYRGTAICRSMERPQSIIGFKIGSALVDELDTLDQQRAKEAWRKIIARLSWGGAINGADVTTTPEGFKETHRLFVSDIAAKPELAKLYGIVHASTRQNLKNLPSDYIQSLIDTYPSELVDAYVDGRFCNLTQGTVYGSYNRMAHDSRETINGSENLFIGMDFNVGKMAATIYIQRPNGFHAVAEFKDVFDTPAMIHAINSRWGWAANRIVVYPDASGGSRKSVNASTSDIALLRLAGYDVRCNTTNPYVRDRVLAVNKLFERGLLWINQRQCPTVAKNLEQQAYDDNGEPDKKTGFDHQNDATGYPIAYEFPIIKPMQKIRLAGH